jgi:hypothetical protein
VLEPTLRPVPELAGTPMPGSPYAATMPVEKSIAAKKGKIPPKSTDLFAPALPPSQPYAAPSSEPAKAAEPEPVSAEAPSPPAEPEPEDPPIDLPQGDRGPG